MSIVKVCNDVGFLKEKCDVAIRASHKHFTFQVKKGGTFIV
jgi:hypothetical protein